MSLITVLWEEIWGEISALFCLPRRHVTLPELPLGFSLSDMSLSPTVTVFGVVWCSQCCDWIPDKEPLKGGREDLVWIRVWGCGPSWQKLLVYRWTPQLWWQACEPASSHVDASGSREGGDCGTCPFFFLFLFSVQFWTLACGTVPPLSWVGGLSPDLSLSGNVLTGTHKVYLTNTLGVS